MALVPFRARRGKRTTVIVPKTTKKQREDNRIVRKKDVKRMLNANIENKYLQAEFTLPNYIDTAGTLQQLNIMGQGTDNGQRVGQQIRHCKLDLRFQCFNAASNFCRVRFILFWYRQETGSTPTVASILATNSVAVNGTANSIVSSYYMRNESAYQIIYDKTMTLTSGSATLNANYPGTSTSVGGVPVAQFRLIKNLKRKIGVYNGPASGDPMTKGYLGAIILSDVNSAALNAQKPQWTWHYTLTYEDA